VPRRRKTLITICDHKPQGRQGETTSAISQDRISVRITTTNATGSWLKSVDYLSEFLECESDHVDNDVPLVPLGHWQWPNQHRVNVDHQENDVAYLRTHRHTSRYHYHHTNTQGLDWLGHWICDSRGHEFDSRLFHSHVTTLGKLFTHVPLSPSRCGTGSRTVMLYGWEVTMGLVSHWPCVTNFNGLSTYGLMA